jgi:hypothetical protein
MTYKANSIASLLIATVLILLALFTVLVLIPDRRRQLSPVVRCGTVLSRLGKDILIYANDHNDNLPQSLDNLADYIKGDIDYSCPASGVDYVYIKGRAIDMQGNTIIAYCPVEHRLYDHEIDGLGDELGLNVLFLGSYVKTIDVGEIEQLFLEQDINYTTMKGP